MRPLFPRLASSDRFARARDAAGRGFRAISVFTTVLAVLVLIVVTAINSGEARTSASSARKLSAGNAEIVRRLAVEESQLSQLVADDLAGQKQSATAAAAVAQVVDSIETELAAICQAVDCGGVRLAPLSTSSSHAASPRSTTTTTAVTGRKQPSKTPGKHPHSSGH